MKIGLPQYFPLSATVRQDKLDRSSADFSHGSWLQDESIDFVQNHLTVEGAFLPQNVLIVEARTATLIGLGQAPAVKSTLAGLRVSDKDLVFCPVNNSSDGSADSGSHWSVIFGAKARSGWRCFHLDASKNSGNDAKATVLAARLFGRAARCENVPAAQQRNGHDCGVYMLLFEQVVLDAYLAHSNASRLCVDASWRRRVLAVKPVQAREFRNALLGKCLPPGLRGLAEEENTETRPSKRVFSSGYPRQCVACGSATLPPKGECWNPDCDRCWVVPSLGAGAQIGKGLCGTAKRPAAKQDTPSSTQTSRGTDRIRAVNVPSGPRGSSSPYPWSPSYSVGEFGGKKEQCKGTRLRPGNLNQPLYGAMCAMSEAAAKKFASELGFMPKQPPAVSRGCFACGGELALKKWAEKAQLRCKDCKRHFDGERAYTPLFNTSIKWRDYLSVAYCYSMGLRQDQAYSAFHIADVEPES